MRLLLSYDLADNSRGAISLLWGCPLSVEASEGLPWRNIGFLICIFFSRYLAASQAISVIFHCLSWPCVFPWAANQELLLCVLLCFSDECKKKKKQLALGQYAIS